jgi:23S rRNA pseudouridine1911/1915/1917 synthase
VYFAIVYGLVRPVRGLIDLPLRVDALDRRRVIATAGGRSSRTRFVRLAQAGGLSLLSCRLITGRRHQIRVHLSARGWPVVGDPVYGSAGKDGDPRWRQIGDRALGELVREFPRQALHAWRVAFTHPVTGDRLAIDAPVPSDLDALAVAAGFNRPAGLSL